jgi:hypothetical protein
VRVNNNFAGWPWTWLRRPDAWDRTATLVHEDGDDLVVLAGDTHYAFAREDVDTNP